MSRQRREPSIRATCTFSEGHVARLPVADLYPEGAFICSVRPPQVGLQLEVSLEADGEPPIHAISSRVISARVDPASAERSGFEIRFLELEHRQRERLLDLLAFLSGQKLPSRRQPLASSRERRAQPRVHVDFRADVNLASGTETFRMQNLSMSGALLVLEDGHLAPELSTGAKTTLLVYAPDIPEALSLRCEVVRTMIVDDPPRVAVRFEQLSETTAPILESLILYAIIQQGFPTYPLVGG